MWLILFIPFLVSVGTDMSATCCSNIVSDSALRFSEEHMQASCSLMFHRGARQAAHSQHHWGCAASSSDEGTSQQSMWSHLT